MGKICKEAGQILEDRFGRDTVIALATAEAGRPYVRWVDAFYEDGAFYVVTHKASNKMRHIAQCPAVSVAGDWFTAQGTGEDLGAFSSPANQAAAEKLAEVFAGWLGNGHTDPQAESTHILRVNLETGVLFSQGVRYDIDFRG